MGCRRRVRSANGKARAGGAQEGGRGKRSGAGRGHRCPGTPRALCPPPAASYGQAIDGIDTHFLLPRSLRRCFALIDGNALARALMKEPALAIAHGANTSAGLSTFTSGRGPTLFSGRRFGRRFACGILQTPTGPSSRTVRRYPRRYWWISEEASVACNVRLGARRQAELRTGGACTTAGRVVTRGIA